MLPKKKDDIKKSIIPTIGSWAFIIGVIFALISGFWPLTTMAITVMIVLGIVVGFLNITGSESLTFLMVIVALVIISAFGGEAFAQVAGIGVTLQRILNNLMLFIIPAAMVVALKTIITIAHKN